MQYRDPRSAPRNADTVATNRAELNRRGGRNVLEYHVGHGVRATEKLTRVKDRVRTTEDLPRIVDDGVGAATKGRDIADNPSISSDEVVVISEASRPATAALHAHRE